MPSVSGPNGPWTMGHQVLAGHMESKEWLPLQSGLSKATRHCKMLGRKMGLRVRWPGLECELAHCHVSLDKALGKPEYLQFLLCEMWGVNNENLFPNVS